MTPTPPFVTDAPRDLAGWLRLFDAGSLPVLGETAATIEDWRSNEDAVDAHLLAESLSADPLMTLKLLAHVGQNCRRRRWDDGADGGAETVTAALVLLGIGPFFRVFGPQPVVEEALASLPAAWDGFHGVLQRSRRAAAFALGFAAHRMDPDASVIHEAALLHDFAELLLWLRAPALALQMAERQRQDPALRSAKVQRELLHVELAELQHALMTRWSLPPLLVQITDDQRADDVQVRNVLLAVRVARHSARGWDNPALPDDVRDVAQLLQLGEEPARRLLLDIDADA